MISFLDFIYPPLCKSCRERCETQVLCPDCWRLCELPDPASRCRQCFEELDQRGNLCQRCRQRPFLPLIRATVFDAEAPARFLGLDSPKAMAAFAFVQWIQLEWPLPDAIIPMPDAHSIAVGKAFTQLIERPFVRALKADCEYRDDRLEEDGQLLLIDISNSVEKLEKAALALSESFPKKIYLLTLFPYAYPVS